MLRSSTCLVEGRPSCSTGRVSPVATVCSLGANTPKSMEQAAGGCAAGLDVHRAPNEALTGRVLCFLPEEDSQPPLHQMQDEVSAMELVLCSRPSANPSSRMLLASVGLRGGAWGGHLSSVFLPRLVESDPLFHSQGCGTEVRLPRTQGEGGYCWW